MKFSDHSTLMSEVKRAKVISGLILLLGLTANGPLALAQSVITASPAVSNLPATLVRTAPSDSAPAASTGDSPFHWDVVTLRPHLAYRFLHGDGILSAPGQTSSTSIQSISPGLLLNIGDHWNLDYTATKTYYSDSNFKDTLDHAVNLVGGATLSDWVVQLSQNYSSTSPTLVETARQTKEKVYSASFSAVHSIGVRSQTDTSLTYQARTSASYPNSRDSNIEERLHYNLSDRLDSSAGLGFGRTNLSVGSDMTHYQPSLRLNWKIADKVAAELQAGYEIRKFDSGGLNDLKTPTFGASLHYQAFPTTSISAGASRGVSASLFENQATRFTGWNLDLQQRLLQKFYLGLSYTGQKSTYVSTAPGVVAGRDDQTYTFTARLSTVFFQRATAAIFYQNAHNSTNRNGFGFTSSQSGLELSYRF